MGISLNVKIIFTVFVAALISATSGVVGFLSALESSTIMERLVTDEFLYYQSVTTLRSQFHELRLLEKDILLSLGDTKTQEAYKGAFENLLKTVEAQAGKVQTLVARDTHFDEETRRTAASLRADLGAYASSSLAVYSRILSGQDFTPARIRSLALTAERHINVLEKDILVLGRAGELMMKEITEEGITNTKNSLFLLVVIMVTALVLSLINGYFMASRITKPLRKAAQRLEAIASGGGDLTQKLEVKTQDELGKLSREFNAFTEGLSKVIKSISKSTTQLKGLGLDLSANMEESSSSVNQIAANIESVKQLIINQSSGVTEVSSTIEQIDKNIESLSKRITHQTQSVSRSSSSIEEMVANIQSVTRTLETNSSQFNELLKVSAEGREKLEEVTLQIREVSRQSEGLMEANTVIESIASQTNLLAMNAAIEAAHAGEAGKGFAVVSDEIRKLAEGAAVQSKSISGVLQSLIASIETVVESTTEATQSFGTVQDAIEKASQMERQVKSAMEEQSAGSNEVLESLSDISSITSEVNSGAIEMRQGSATILEEMLRLVRISQEVRESMDEMTQGIVEINSSFASIVTMTQQNRDAIDNVEEQVSHFKIS